MAGGSYRRLAKALAEADALRAEKEKQARPPEPEPISDPEPSPEPSVNQRVDPAPEPPPKREGIKGLAFDCVTELNHLLERKPFSAIPLKEFIKWLERSVFSFKPISPETKQFLSPTFGQPYQSDKSMRESVARFYNDCRAFLRSDIIGQTPYDIEKTQIQGLLSTFLKLAGPSEPDPS